MKRWSRWHCWHDDGRYMIVQTWNDRQVFDMAMEIWGESDINLIAVERIEDVRN